MLPTTDRLPDDEHVPRGSDESNEPSFASAVRAHVLRTRDIARLDAQIAAGVAEVGAARREHAELLERLTLAVSQEAKRLRAETISAGTRKLACGRLIIAVDELCR